MRAARGSGPRPEERLTLLEFLLSGEDPAELADRCLAWLSEHAGAREGHCLVIDSERTHLIHLTGRGPSRGAPGGIAVDLESRDHPLVRALGSVQPVVVTDHVAELGSSRRAPFLAVPLHGVEIEHDASAGLLLLSPATVNRVEVEWVAEYLGHRLVRTRLHATGLETERRLRRERDLLQSILDRVTDPILLTDSEGRMVVANAPAERLLAARDDESEGRRRAVAINNMLFSSALGRSAVEPGAPTQRELLLVDPAEGSDLLFELLSTTAGDARMGMGIVSILRNVSDLRRATEEIQENYGKLRAAEAVVRAERDRLDLVIDSVADPILVTDPSGNLVMMNVPAERLFSASAKASPATAQRVQANDANFTSFVSNLLFGQGDQSRHHGSINLVDPNTGHVIPVEAISGKVYGEGAELSAIVTILHDQTEALEREELYERLKAASAQLERRVHEATSTLVHQNERLRRQALELEQASVAKSQFLANVSHDVRTPLNAILGYTNLLLRGVSGELGSGQRESLGRVDANARHLLTLINEILDLSRIEAGKMPVRLAPFKMSELIQEIMSEVEPIIGRTRLEVTAHVPTGFPAIRSDRQKIKQILLNLLTNALKFTPRGSVTLTCTHQRRSRDIAIAVSDTGIGIAEADQARIFEPFSQADPAQSRDGGGTGLGLAICHRLATVLGGRITLESKPRHGSTFTLSIPVGSRAS